MATRKLKIEGMSCNNCATRVAKALREVPGVVDARVSVEDGTAQIDTSGEVDAATLAGAVEKKGYRAAVVS